MVYKTFNTVILRTPTGIGDEFEGRFGRPEHFLSGTCIYSSSGTNKWRLVRKTDKEGRKMARSHRTEYRPIWKR